MQKKKKDEKPMAKDEWRFHSTVIMRSLLNRHTLIILECIRRGCESQKILTHYMSSTKSSSSQYNAFCSLCKPRESVKNPTFTGQKLWIHWKSQESTHNLRSVMCIIWWSFHHWITRRKNQAQQCKVKCRQWNKRKFSRTWGKVESYTWKSI